MISGIAASAAAVSLLRRWIVHRQILDHPNDRSLHSIPVPRGGGIAILLVTVAGTLLLDLGSLRFLLPWSAAALLLGFIGFIDDVRGLSPVLRLAIQLALAIMTVVAYGAFEGLSFSAAGSLKFGAAAGAMTVIWIAGFTNAFNFMDGVDGIAGVQALAAGTAWAAIAYRHSNRPLLHIAILVAASSAGFLMHNWNPARIFMGDVGSTFLGYTLAVLGLFDAATRHDLLLPALVLWPFLFDSSFTLLRRLGRRERVWTAHRSHLYQRLTLEGWSHARVSLLYLMLAASGGIVAIALDRGLLTQGSSIGIVVSLAALLWLLTRRAEKESRRAASPIGSASDANG
jgi:UDP-N-acetylmuramyl pentapeptide phosphotransferase/UDP-N-acetylglucosamine-1-phosphate transferase